ncbi:Transcription initiation factor TFIID subunit 4 [Nymphon striatum]|nr:Transcription initiation factor TFIID subunit 4 [Nymphon striatum]
MATKPKSLEDMLSCDVDESAVSELVGSLESQLSSPTTHGPVSDTNSATIVVNNHVNNALIPDGRVAPIPASQKLGTANVNNLNQSNTGNTSGNIIANSDISLKQITSNGPHANVSRPVIITTGATIGPGQPTGVVTCNPSGVITQATTGTTNIQIKNTVSNNNSNVNGTNFSSNHQHSFVTTPLQVMPNGNVSSVPDSGNSQKTLIANTSSGNLQSVIGSNTITSVSSNQTQTIVAPNHNLLNASNIINSSNVTQSIPMAIVSSSSDSSSSVINQTMLQQPSAGVNVLKTCNPSTNVSSVISAPKSVVGGNNVVTQVVSSQPGSVLQGVQILNVNPNNVRTGNTPVTIAVSQSNLVSSIMSTSSQQKTLAPRVVIAGNPVRIAGGQQVITGRPSATNAMQNTITLQPGMVRGTLLVKTENGQYQLVNVGPPLTQSSNASNIPGAAAYRFQHTTQGQTRTITPQQLAVSLPVSATNGQVKVHQTISSSSCIPQTLSSHSGPIPVSMQQPAVSTNSSIGQPLSVQTTISSQAGGTASQQQMSPDTAKKKCTNFLSTLIRLAGDQPEHVAKNDGKVNPEDFTVQLQKELHSSPQPCLVPFLKKSLPYLRHSLASKEQTIPGVRPPPPGTVITLPSIPQTIPTIQLTQGRAPVSTAQQIKLLSSGVPTMTRLPQGIPQRPSIINQRVQPVKPGVSKIVSNFTTMSPATVTAIQARTSKVSALTAGKEKPEKRAFSSLRDDDDINDVAAMGGVNLLEESAKILAVNSDLVGTQIRSCKDENFLFTSPLHRKVKEIVSKHGLDEVSPEVIGLVSHAVEERLKNIIEKLGVIAEHRMENVKNDPRYEITSNVRGQIKFLEELDKLEKKRHEEEEREILLRAAKSRSKVEDPEQQKLKLKAKEMQRQELEEMRQREANTTALLAIGPRKKFKAETASASTSQVIHSNIRNKEMKEKNVSGNSSGASGVSSRPVIKPRVKRVNMRDLLFLLEQDKDMCKSTLLYQSYLR